MVNTFIMMGLPGAGKGKQTELLSAKTGFVVSSTGNELRKLAKEGGILGKKVSEIMEVGDLIPSWLASYLFQKALFNLSSEQDGAIFEGVGRKEEEARLFNEVAGWLGRDFRILNLIISEDVARSRLNKRRELEGRNDDDPAIFHNRFKNFYESTMPALEYFRSIGKVIDINGEPLPEVVFEEIWEKISVL
jgi:adenylate kinase